MRPLVVVVITSGRIQTTAAVPRTSLSFAFLALLALCCQSAPAPKKAPPIDRNATWFCPARAMPNFPDPPPPSSYSARIPRDQLFGADVEVKTLRQVARKLESLFAQGSFQHVSFMGFGCSGFAVLAELERIRADGTPFSGLDRFGPAGPADRFDLDEVAQRLHYAPNGYYRQTVFLVSDDLPEEADTLQTADDLQNVVATGQLNLPYGYDEIPFGPQHSVRVLLYEFEKGPGDKQVRNIDSENDPAAQQRARIYRGLGAPGPPDD